MMNEIRFLKETYFQETTVGKIPKEWEVVRLGDAILEAQSGFASGRRDENGILQLRMDSIETDGRINVEGGVKVPIPQNVEDYILRPGDVLFNNTNSVDLIGKTAIFRGEFPKSVYSNHLTRIRVDRSKVLPEWLVYSLIRKWQLGFFRAICHRHVHQAGINNSDLANVKISVPSIAEQRAVVGVLGVVDLAVARAGEVIAKTERLKKGLMQELLTRGIGHKEYKQTPIGKIPKTWEVVKLKDVVGIDIESKDPSREMPDKTFLYVDIDSIEGETGKIRNPKRILGREAPSRARRVIHENDVIMSTVRPYLKAFAIIPKEYDNQICSTGFAVLSCGDHLLPYFLLNVLFSSQIINQCNRMMVGGQYPALNQSQVFEIKIPLPPLTEQQKIADFFFTIDRKLELERNEKEKLERTKHGLMDLLLTGKVRVKVE